MTDTDAVAATDAVSDPATDTDAVAVSDAASVPDTVTDPDAVSDADDAVPTPNVAPVREGSCAR